MTSNLATNAVLQGQGYTGFLAADKNGFPLQKQVPKTYQYYSGTGGSVALDGSDYLVIANTLATDLTVNISRLANGLGRQVKVICLAAAGAGRLIFSFPGATIYTQGSTIAGTTLTINADALPSNFSLEFISGDSVLITVSGLSVDPAVFPSGLRTELIEADISLVNEFNNAAVTPIAFLGTGINTPAYRVNTTTYPFSSGAAGVTSAWVFPAIGLLQVDFECYLDGSLTAEVEVDLWDETNGVVLARTNSVQGLSGHYVRINRTVDTGNGVELRIRSANASGPDSGTVNVAPAQIIDGKISFRRLNAAM